MQVDDLITQINASAAQLRDWITSFHGDPLALLRALKFEPVGRHPIGKHALNAVEQINQTWTYLAALAAVRLLLELHPEAGGFSIAPGAHAAQPLDVMSRAPGVVGAETFAAVDPRNNRKLTNDLDKLIGRNEAHRYVLFCFAHASRHSKAGEV